MTYGPITMATGAQPADAQKRHSCLTGLGWALMERQVFQRKDVFSRIRCPFVFIQLRSKSPVPSLLSHSSGASPRPISSSLLLSFRFFFSLSSKWDDIFSFYPFPLKVSREGTPVRACKTHIGCAWLCELSSELW